MKKTELKLSPVAAIVAAMLALSACGKNMNLSVKDQGLKNGKPVGSDVGGDNKGTGDKKLVAGYPATDGKLEPLSVWDMGDTESPFQLPYYNKIEITDSNGKKSMVPSLPTQIGDPANAVEQANLVFRAIKRVPKKELVESIADFSVKLHNVRLFNLKGQDRKVLKSQLLCLVDVSTGADKSRACSGEKDESNADNINGQFFDSVKDMSKDFSSVAVPAEAGKVKHDNIEGVILTTDKGADVEINLLKALGLDGKKIEEQMDWIMNNTTLYSGDAKGPGYRKFRFVVANNVYIESGQLNLQFIMKKDAKDVVEAAGEPTHGETDKQSQLQAQLDAAKKAKEEADKQAAEAAKKNAAPANLAYAGSPYTLTKGVEMAAVTPTSEGGVITECKSEPVLPAGLVLGSNCVLSGTPTAAQAATEYTITATNVGGSATAKISIAVSDPGVNNGGNSNKVVQAPAGLAYAGDPLTLTKDVAMATLTPTATGDAITACTSSPQLPAGLVLGTDCSISGTPTTVQAAAPYAITATNAGGSATANISIAVVEVTGGGQTNKTDNVPVVDEHTNNKKTKDNENGADITAKLFDKNLKFAINRWDISDEDIARLVATAEQLQKIGGSNVQVILTGRTSITVPKKPMTNQKIATNRANAVADILRANSASLKADKHVLTFTKIPKTSYCGPKQPECDYDRRGPRSEVLQIGS